MLHLSVRAVHPAHAGDPVHAGDQSRPELEFDFDRSLVLVGRGAGVDVRLPHPEVSCVHLRIERQGFAYRVIDQDSRNGTRLAGRQLDRGSAAMLRDGDELEIGPFRLRVSLSRADGARGETPAEATAAMARRMVRESLAALPAGDVSPALVVESLAGNGADGGTGSGTRLEIAELGRIYLVGRDRCCDLRLDDPETSREQLAVRRDLGGVFLRDLGGKNPTLWLEHRRPLPASEQALHDGDHLLCGSVILCFSDPVERQLNALAREDAVGGANRAGGKAASPASDPQGAPGGTASRGCPVASDRAHDSGGCRDSRHPRDSNGSPASTSLWLTAAALVLLLLAAAAGLWLLLW